MKELDIEIKEFLKDVAKVYLFILFKKTFDDLEPEIAYKEVKRLLKRFSEEKVSEDEM